MRGMNASCDTGYGVLVINGLEALCQEVRMFGDSIRIGCLSGVALFAAAACGSDEELTVESFRQALPSAKSATIDGPERESPPDVSGAAATADADAAESAGPSEWAEYYAFTREVRDGVNAITASVLGTVWFVAGTNPSEISEDEAIWGPYTDALEPATWRFRMKREGEGEYSYVLEGRPKDSEAEQDYRVVISGTGYDASSAQHGDGSFTIDIDEGKRLDPFAYGEDDSGSIAVTHELPPDVTSEVGALPRTIDVELRPAAGQEHLTVHSEAREDGTGLIAVDGVWDIDEEGQTALEDVTIVSQWNVAGAGRSTVTIAGGDLPASIDSVEAVECWDESFRRAYYSDSVGFQETVGTSEACAVQGDEADDA